MKSSVTKVTMSSWLIFNIHSVASLLARNNPFDEMCARVKKGRGIIQRARIWVEQFTLICY